jgi:hypothetical protein
VKVIDVAASAKNASQSSVAMTADGRFDVAYQFAFSSSDSDVYMSRFSSAGVLLGNNAVAASFASEGAPSVSVDDAGNAVVAYQKSVVSNGNITVSIGVRRVTSAGVVGPEKIIPSIGGYAVTPSVAVKRAGGGYVVGYITTLAFGEFFNPTAFVTEVDANDAVKGTFSLGAQRFVPSVSIDGTNQYLAGTLNVFPNRKPYGRFGTLA